MLSGESSHRFDAKYRVTIPAKFRDELGAEFVITKGTDRCLNVFPMEYWKSFEAGLAKLPRNKDARDYIRHMVGSAEKVAVDKMGRALISQALRDYAGLTKEVVLIGVIDRLEIWDKDSWDERSRAVSDNVEEIAERLADLGFEI